MRLQLRGSQLNLESIPATLIDGSSRDTSLPMVVDQTTLIDPRRFTEMSAVSESASKMHSSAMSVDDLETTMTGVSPGSFAELVAVARSIVILTPDESIATVTLMPSLAARSLADTVEPVVIENVSNAAIHTVMRISISILLMYVECHH